MRCIEIPFPIVIWPMISSPYIGEQHFANLTMTLSLPPTTMALEESITLEDLAVLDLFLISIPIKLKISNILI